MPPSAPRATGRVLTAATLTAVGVVTFAAALTGPAAAGPAATRYVATTGTDSGDCSDQASPCLTINYAIGAATAGDTIVLAAGVYAESVQITKPLTILGAQNGTAPVNGPIDVADQSVIRSAHVPFTYGGGVSTGTIEGVTIDGAGTSPVGIAAFGSSGDHYTWTDDIIENSAVGINVNASGTDGRTSISDDLFLKNIAPGDASGTGIFFTNAPSHHVDISDNLFHDDGTVNSANGEINTTGSGSAASPSTDITITGNVQTLDNSPGNDQYENNFGALFNTVGMLVQNNNVVDDDPADPNADTAIYVGGAVSNATISGNVIGGGAAAAGVNINSDFYDYPAPANITVSGNTITHRGSGVRVRGDLQSGTHAAPTGVTVSGNVVAHSATYGLWVQTGAGGETLTGNTVSDSGTADCADETSGSGTSGTADTWTDDTGATSTPLGLCTEPLLIGVSGSQTFGDPTPNLTYDGTARALDGTLTCATVDGGTPITPTLAPGHYTIDGTSCSGQTPPAGYSLDYQGLPGGFVVNKAGAMLTARPVSAVASLLGLKVTFSATLTTAQLTGKPLAGRTVRFSSGALVACTATTGADGVATCSANVLTVVALLLTQGYTATFAGDADYLTAAAHGAVHLI